MSNEKEQRDFDAGFSKGLEEEGEEAVSRKLASGDLPYGKAEMARTWLDGVRAARTERIEFRAKWAFRVSMAAFLVSIVALAISALRH